VKLALVVDSPGYGGAEQCVVQLARGLPPTVDRTVLATEPVPPQVAAAVSALVPLPPVRGRADGADRVASALAGLRPDVVHVNLIDPATCVELLAGAVGSGVPTVADVHMVGTTGDRIAPAYAGCAAVLARSRPIADLLAGAYGLPAERLHVIRNGVPVTPAAPPAGAPPGEPVRIRAVGRLTRQKGFDLLIAATRRLVAAGLPVDVAVAGAGRDRDALVAAARGLPVRFTGFRDDVPAFLRAADVFCLPSRAEALPLALLEAVVAGLPCVATDVGDIAATLAGIAVVVPPEDVDALTAALAGLVTDPARRRRLAARARAAADRFDERRTVAAVHEVYRRVA
jgi:glycosyltransferase involved in cell wall biosynthesis